MRHIEKYHRDENEIKKILEYPKNSKERRQAFLLFRNNTNFDLFINGEVRPNRKTIKIDSSTFYPCIYCKGMFNKNYLKRHVKSCKSKIYSKPDTSYQTPQKYYVTDSQTLAACAMDPTNVISRLNVKSQVYYFLIYNARI